MLVRMGGERLEAGRASHPVLTLTLCRNVLDLPCEVVTLGLLGELRGGLHLEGLLQGHRALGKQVS